MRAGCGEGGEIAVGRVEDVIVVAVAGLGIIVSDLGA